MSSNETQIVRDVLATMVADAPPPIEFEDLAETRLAPITNRKRISAPVAALAGFAVVLAIVGGVIAATRPAQPSPAAAQATIFLLPTAMPDDLELYRAEVWSDGNATSQVYLPPGETTYAEGDRVVNIDVTDSVRMAQGEGVDPTELLNADAPSTLFASLIEIQETTYPDSELSFEETTIRGKPALLVERITTIGQITDIAIGVVVIEGNGIITGVDTHQVDRQDAIAIAEGLRATTAETFATYSRDH